MKESKRKFSPKLVGRSYDKVTREVMDKLNLEDTFQALRTEPIEDLHEHNIMAAGIRDHMKILDAGCGIGGPGIYFAQKMDVKVESINISQVQVSIFKSRIAELGLSDKINVIHGDFHNLDHYYPESSFDIILFLESFGHAAEPEMVLRSARKVLKEDGILFIKDPFITWTFNIFNRHKINNTIRILSNHYRYHFMWLRQLKRLLQAERFEIISISEIDFENSNWNLTYQYETIANLNFYKRGKPFNYMKYYEIRCRK